MNKISLISSPRAAAPRVSRRALLGALGVGGAALASGWQPTAPASPRATPAAASALDTLPRPIFQPAASRAVDALQRPAFEAAARRAVDGLLARLNPEAAYRPRFLLDLSGDGARLVHDDYWDGVDLAGRTVDALIRLRRVLGGDASDAELNLRNYFLARQGERGLFYGEGGPTTAVADSFSQSRALLGLTSWFASSGDAEVETRLHWLIDGLASIATTDGDSCYFPGRRFLDRWQDYSLMSAEARDRLDAYGYGSQTALPLMEYYGLSGHRPTLDLAGRLLRHFVHRSGMVDAEGRFAGETHASGYLGMAVAAVRYGVATGQAPMVDWADRLYRWVRAHSSDFGWVPGPLGLGPDYYRTWYDAPVRSTCETCSLADTINLAILLAGQDRGEYWDDVERFARNQLLQNQFGSAEAVLGAAACARVAPDVRSALAGGWESFALPYRLLARPDDRRWIEGCCSASGARALSLVWDHALEQRGSTLYLHLGLSRDSALAQVESHEPAEGRVDVVPRASAALRLRVPTWAVADSLTLWVGDAQRDVRREGGYVAVDEVPAGTCVSLRYALVERTETFTVNDETTVAHWRGGTVLWVDPERGQVPIYQPRRAALLAAAEPPAASSPGCADATAAS